MDEKKKIYIDLSNGKKIYDEVLRQINEAKDLITYYRKQIELKEKQKDELKIKASNLHRQLDKLYNEYYRLVNVSKEQKK